MTKRPTLLIADDYPQNRRLFSLFLKKAYEIVEAASAEEVLEILEAQSVDALLLDLNYQGGMSGMELIARVRQDPRWTDLPAIALTAHASPEDRTTCIEAGFDDFVSKPVFREPLNETVASVLGRPRLAA
ncbi:MAG: response regulator [Bacteroidota bacterium]